MLINGGYRARNENGLIVSLFAFPLCSREMRFPYALPQTKRTNFVYLPIIAAVGRNENASKSRNGTSEIDGEIVAFLKYAGIVHILDDWKSIPKRETVLRCNGYRFSPVAYNGD